jgi:GWxTD domain-containing protein
MRHYITVFLLLTCAFCQAQALRDINYNYLYNPEERIICKLKPIRQADSWKLLYALQLRDTAENIGDYNIEWLGRDGLNSKEDLALGVSSDDEIETDSRISGSIRIPLSNAPKIIVAKVSNSTTRRAYLFYTHLEATYPVNNYVIEKGQVNFKPYSTASQVNLGDTTGNWIVSYYNDKFPAAAPAFSEAQARVARSWKADSVFTVRGSSPVDLFANGLFLMQKDTFAAEGFAIRSEKDYPRYATIQNLPGPLIYICTKQEYDRLETAKGDKKAFDRTVLSITNDAERAKKLIRDYFRRVELANLYFTSYKEGWKTDRGMVYIIFGLPNEVFKFNDREVWNYDKSSFNTSFNFTKASSVFDPDNYVLIREKKYQTIWYEVIDLWRNVRL